MTFHPKFVFVCSPCVGKTALIHRISSNEFINSHHVFIDDETEKSVHFNKQDHPVTLFDTFDDLECEDLMAEYVYYGDGLFVVYSISDRKSFDGLELIIGDGLCSRDGKDTPMIVVGNECDVEEERQVTTEEGKAFAERKEKRMEFIEVSAKTLERGDEMVIIFIQKTEEIAQKKQNSNREKTGVKKDKCFIQ